MKLCLSCYHLSPGESVYCGTCGRSFGGRICRTKKKHLSPPSAQVCVQCGSTDLTDSTLFFPLGWIWRTIVFGCLLLLLWGSMPTIIVLSGRIFDGRFSPIVLLDTLLFWLIVFGFFYWLLSIIPGGVGKQLLKLIDGTLQLLVKQIFSLTHSVIKATFKLLRTLIVGDRDNKT